MGNGHWTWRWEGQGLGEGGKGKGAVGCVTAVQWEMGGVSTGMDGGGGGARAAEDIEATAGAVFLPTILVIYAYHCNDGGC